MEHYILIRVTEEQRPLGTRAGFLRRQIHSIASECNIEIADHMIRQDRMHFMNGKKVPYEATKELFDSIGDNS